MAAVTLTTDTDMDDGMENPQANEDDLKKRLLKRTALALVVLAGLVGSLAVFDRLNEPDPEPAKLAVAAPPVVPPVAPPVTMATPDAAKEPAPVSVIVVLLGVIAVSGWGVGGAATG